MSEKTGIIVEQKNSSFFYWLFSNEDFSRKTLIVCVVVVIMAVFPIYTLYGVIGLFFGMFLLLGAFVGSPSQLKYVPGLKYYIEPPLGWEQEIFSTPNIVRFCESDNSRITISAHIMYENLDIWKKEYLTEEKYHLINEKNYTKHNVNYLRLILTYNQDVKQQFDACIVKGVLYQFGYVSKIHSFEKNYKSYENLFGSFQLLI
jgi:hypothetical protein